jgi:hypothetical protein
MAQVVEQKADSPKFHGSHAPFTIWSSGLLCLISLIVTSKTFQT